MKGLPVTLPVRRVAAALALGVALATAGCGTAEAGRAATVDGRVITEDEVQTAQSQINTAFPDANLTTDDVLTRLINAPYVLDFAAQQGNPQSASVARSNFPAGMDPAPETIELLRGQYALQFLQQAGQQIPVETFQKLQVEVNPRYGSYDASTAAVAASLPTWVTPYNADQ